MAKTLNDIFASFRKTLKELDTFIAEQHKRQDIAVNNIQSLADMIDKQNVIIDDAVAQRAAAVHAQAKISDIIGAGPVTNGV